MVSFVFLVPSSLNYLKIVHDLKANLALTQHLNFYYIQSLFFFFELASTGGRLVKFPLRIFSPAPSLLFLLNPLRSMLLNKFFFSRPHYGGRSIEPLSSSHITPASSSSCGFNFPTLLLFHKLAKTGTWPTKVSGASKVLKL